MVSGDWKHSATLIATCVFGFVVFSPETFVRVPWLIAVSKFAMLGGLSALGIAGHQQSLANAAAIKQVDDKVVDTHKAINGRMDQLVAASKAQGAADQRAETRADNEQGRP
jgi:hypothetical protein